MDIGDLSINCIAGSDYLLKILQERIETFFKNYSLRGCTNFEAYVDKKDENKIFITPRIASSIDRIVEKATGIEILRQDEERNPIDIYDADKKVSVIYFIYFKSFL